MPRSWPVVAAGPRTRLRAAAVGPHRPPTGLRLRCGAGRCGAGHGAVGVATLRSGLTGGVVRPISDGPGPVRVGLRAPGPAGSVRGRRPRVGAGRGGLAGPFHSARGRIHVRGGTLRRAALVGGDLRCAHCDRLACACWGLPLQQSIPDARERRHLASPVPRAGLVVVVAARLRQPDHPSPDRASSWVRRSRRAMGTTFATLQCRGGRPEGVGVRRHRRRDAEGTRFVDADQIDSIYTTDVRTTSLRREAANLPLPDGSTLVERSSGESWAPTGPLSGRGKR